MCASKHIVLILFIFYIRLLTNFFLTVKGLKYISIKYSLHFKIFFVILQGIQSVCHLTTTCMDQPWECYMYMKTINIFGEDREIITMFGISKQLLFRQL